MHNKLVNEEQQKAKKTEYVITTDKSLMNPVQIHKWLSEKSYWSVGIPYYVVKTCFDNSFCIGVLSGKQQIGYARLVTDYISFAYLADVYIEDAHRGKGLGKRMISTLMEIEWVKNTKRFQLGTKDAHNLYKGFGFSALEAPERHMELVRTGWPQNLKK